MKLTVTLEKPGLTFGDIWHALQDEAIDWRDSGNDWDTPVNPNGSADRQGPNDVTITWEVTD